MPKPKKNIPPEVSKAASALGSKGGKSGTGDKKRRDPEFYSVKLPEIRRTNAMKRKLLGEK